MVETQQTRPILAVTMGDPAGIGPEVVARASLEEEIQRQCRLLVVGDSKVMRRAYDLIGTSDRRIHRVTSVEQAQFSSGATEVFDKASVDVGEVTPGQVSSTYGRAAYHYVKQAAELALAGDVQAIATAPLNKEALAAADVPYPGHTEILAHICGDVDVAMMLVTPALRVTHVSTHVSLRRAIELVQIPRILRVIELTHEALHKMEVKQPRIACAGLNPHAGEDGLFGDEEVQIIRPAVLEAQSRGWQISGPFAPDTIFWRASKDEFDAVIAMYHDQGHIPIKLSGFRDGVNVTLGLPIIRTSVDHGTAFDIAWDGIADPLSMVQAINLALQMQQTQR